MSRNAFWVSLIVVMLSLGTRARANVDVGAKPEMEFQPVGSKEAISLATFKGKIIVVDFWATWCGPCMAEADHMVKLHQDFGPKGLQIIGISLDQDVAAMQRVVRDKRFDWPQFCDGKGWQNQFAVAWGVRGIPRTFLISPEGVVLWVGHPAQLDQPLARAFKEHPPQLVDPKVLADAQASLKQVEDRLSASDIKAAVKLMAAVPAAASADEAFAAKVAEVSRKLDDSAKGLLAEIDKVITQKQYVEAIAKLKELSAALGDLPTGAEARKKLTVVAALPEAKTAIEAADRAARSAEALEAARKLQDQKKHEAAYMRFKEIVKAFGGTPAAQAAAAVVADYEKDPAFVKRASEAGVASRAQSLLNVAASYTANGRADLARKKYQEVIDQFPGTSFAEKAQAGLKQLDGR